MARARPHEEMHIGHLTRIPWQAVAGEILRRLAAEGFADLRASHLPVFQHVRREGSRLGQLAALAQMTPQSMGYLVDALADLGYVDRAPDPADRRAVLVRLSARGWAQVAAARRVIAELEAEWASVLGPERYASLRASLADLCAHLEGRGYV